MAHPGSKLTTSYQSPLTSTVRRSAKETTTMSMSATKPVQLKPSNIVEMVGPVTRIVGSLGIYTKIDFGNRVVSECHATSSSSAATASS